MSSRWRTGALIALVVGMGVGPVLPASAGHGNDPIKAGVRASDGATGQNEYDPNDRTVTVGTPVRFSFDNGFHNVVWAQQPTGSTLPDSPGAPGGDAVGSTFSVTPTVAGTYIYYCSIHTNASTALAAGDFGSGSTAAMYGRITVTAGGGSGGSGGTDSSGPVWPPGSTVTATAMSSTRIDLNWSAASDDSGTVFYDVYRASGPVNPGKPVTPFADNVSATTLNVTDLQGGWRYWFWVTPVDSAGNEGTFRTANATTEAAPSWPSTGEVTARATSASEIVLAWPTARDDSGAVLYDVYEASGTSRPAKPARPFADRITVTTLNVSGLMAGTHYWFWITPVDGAGNQGPDRIVDASTVAVAPVWPAGGVVTASVVSERQIDLAWPAAVDDSGQVLYDVYQASGTARPAKPAKARATGITATTLRATELSAGTRYWFWVTPRDAAANVGSDLLGDAATRGGSGQPTAGSSKTHDVDLTADNRFVPSDLSVSVGDTVDFTWRGGFHDVAFADGVRSAAPTAETGVLFTRTFDAPGTYPYVCTVHESIGMIGTVTVVSVAQAGPTVPETSTSDPVTNPAPNSDPRSMPFTGPESPVLPVAGALLVAVGIAGLILARRPSIAPRQGRRRRAGRD